MNELELKNIKQNVNNTDYTKLGSSFNNDLESDTLDYGDMYSVVEHWLSTLSARKLWAKTPIFGFKQDRQKKFWNKLFEDQQVLDNILYIMEQQLVKNGKCYLVVEPSIDNIPVIRMATYGNHFKFGNTVTRANIFTTIANGEYTYNINELYTIGAVKRSITKSGKDIDGTQNISINNFNKEVGATLLEDETFDYPIPVVVVENSPTLDGNGMCDLEGLTPYIISLQKTWNRIQWELDYNRSTILMNDTNASGGSISSLKDSAVNKYKQQNIIVEKSGGNPLGESNTSILVAQLQIDGLSKYFRQTLSQIFEVAGYKRSSDDKGSVQQNDLEIQQVRDSEITSFTRKERSRQNMLKQLITKTFQVAGYSVPSEISIDIQYMNVKNETSMLDNLQKAIDMRLISQVDATAQYRNVTIEEAQEIVDGVNKEADAKMEKMKELSPVVNAPESNTESNTEEETTKEDNNETNI